MSNEPLTHSDRYVRKTNRIILILGIICLCIFLFGLALLGSGEQEEEQRIEVERSIDDESNIALTDDTSNEAEIVFDDAQEQARPITLIPNPINMGQVVLGNEASNVLTVGTDGKKAIKILSVELEEAPFEGFKFETDCKDKELRGKITCNVSMNWLPTVAANVQNNFKIIWRETNVDDANAKHDEVAVFGNSIHKEDCNYCDGGATGVSTVSEEALKGKTRMAVGPDGRIIGVIGEDGVVRDANGNEIGRVNADGMIVDKDGNIIGVASNGKLIFDDNGNVIGYVDESGVAHDNDGNVIGSMLSDGTVVDANGQVLGKAFDFGYVYDDSGNIIGRVLSDGSVVDLEGNVIGKMDKDGNVVDFEGNVIGKVAKAGEIITDNDGNPIGVVMPNGDVVNENGDVIGRLDKDGNVISSQFIGKKGKVTRVAFDAQGNMIGYMDENGNVIDENGNIIGRVTADGNVVDVNGNIIGRVSDEWNDLALDENGKIIGYVDKDGIVHGKDGSIIGYVNADGRIIGNTSLEQAPVIGYVGEDPSVAVDENGNVIGYIDENGIVRDKNGQIIGIRDVDGKIHAFGRKIIGGLIDKDLLPITPAGNILGSINNRGEVINMNKVVGKLRPDGLITDMSGSKVLAKGVNVGYIVNWGCNYDIKLDKDGVIRDMEGNETGYRVYTDRTVWDNSGNFKGIIIQTGSVYDDECNYLGEVNADGFVRDSSGREIGCINPDGTVLDIEEPRLKGHMVAQKMVVSPSNWQPLGVLDANGTLRDKGGEIIGCVNSYGNVFDKNMSYLGAVTNAKYAYGFDGKYLGFFDKYGNLVNSDISSPRLIFDKYIADKSNKIVGYALPEISVLIDGSGNILGHLFPDGMVYDAQGNVVDKFNGGQEGIYNSKAAKFVSSDYVVGIDGINLGKVNYDLNVVDMKGIIIGKINPKGQLFDETGHQIGGAVKQGSARAYNGTSLGYVVSTGEVIQQEEIEDIDGQHYSPGDIMGMVTPDGFVLRDHRVIGEVLPEALMVDVNGNPVGISNDKGSVVSSKGEEISVLLPGGGNTDNIVPLVTGFVIDFKGNVVGIALPTGQFMDDKHMIVGNVLPDGKVVSTNGKILGEIITGDIVIGAEDAVVGTVQFDGLVVKNGNAIGKIVTDGIAIDLQNNILGHTFNIGNTILSNAGEYIGRLAATGHVVVNENDEIGFIKSNGSFVDLDKNVSGYILPEVARNRRN